MKKAILLSALFLTLFACSSNDYSTNIPSVDGSVFIRTSYVIEASVDINGDVIYSNELISESDCYGDDMSFIPDQRVWRPINSFIGLQVQSINGVQVQTSSCSHADGLLPNYAQIDDEVHLLYGEEIDLIGILTPDGNSLTFTIPNELLYAFNIDIFGGNDILNSDGSITNYQGGAVVTYTRQ